MTFTEALKTAQKIPRNAKPFEVVLVCGFTPLHLQTYTTAHLHAVMQNRAVQVTPGMYGNMATTLEGLAKCGAHAVAVALEWPDLDPRLGFREGGGWAPNQVADALASAKTMLDRILGAMLHLPQGTRVVVSLPTLPFAPLFHTPGWQAAETELMLHQLIYDFSVRVARAGIAVMNPRCLDETSAPASRYDLKSDLRTGLPYTLAHADVMGAAFARLIAPPSPKKAIITDLDNTLWHGIVGEIGPGAVEWDLASHHRLHGLYQMLLAAMSQQGVLVGIASKNDPRIVDQTFRREDLLLASSQVFPVEVHWNPKSGSVERILQTWNIAADSVIFVDDSPMELAEVATAHPGIHCIQFPAGDDSAGFAMLRQLRDLCGKERLSEDDALRLDSIREGAAFRQAASGSEAPDAFLRDARAAVTFNFGTGHLDARALELVNKTNQFNLNGARFSEADWQELVSAPGALVAVVSYEDKFGKLGRIAVLQGQCAGRTLSLRVWVMSCRAFARRIEHLCLRVLFDRFNVDNICFDFIGTPRNGPLQDFLVQVTGAQVTGHDAAETFTVTREVFRNSCPELHHTILEIDTNEHAR